MKAARRVSLLIMILLLTAGTIQCAGSQSQVTKESPAVPVSQKIAEMSKEGSREAPPEERRDTRQEASQVPAREARSVAPSEPPKPPRPPLKEETIAQRVEKVPEPPRRVPLPTAPPAVSAPPPVPSAPPTPAPPPPGAPSPVGAPRPVDPARLSRFVLNFDNADIYEVIRVMAEMMNINYIIDPRVKGVVNIRTSGQISQKDIFPVFQTILKMNGAAAVQKGAIYEIVPFGDAKKLFTRPTAGRDASRVLNEEKYTIQIINLKFIPVTEVSKMIKPFLSDGADIVEYPQQNLLVVGDIASNVQKSLNIIELFDEDIFSDMRVRIYPILNADVNEVAKEMERIFSSLEVSLKSGRGVGITFTPIARINSLLAVSSIPGIFDKVERWVKDLDRIPGEGTQLSVFVYYVQNGKAKELADVLKQIYTPVKGAKAEGKAVTPTPGAAPTTPAPRGVRPSPTTPSTPAAAREEGGGVPEGEINIVVDETTNSLIIRAYHRDYKAILETIRKLDIYPKQVLIEVLLAEVTLDDSNKYGLEWSTFSDTFTKGGRSYSYTIGAGGTAPQTAMTSGLRYAVTSVDRLAAAVSASATEDKLRVISSPHVLAANNKEARIQIGRSEPILTNTYTTTGTATAGVVEGTIEYKDIGIILTVTPRISDGKLVTLDISVEQSTVGKTALGNLPEVPYFPKKTAKTTLSIMEKQTVVIGGLIEERKENIKTGIPYLSKIPVLGALFGYHTNTLNKTETIIFLTPHVIGDMGDSERVTEEFREKVYSIQKELEKKKKEAEKEKQKKRKSSPQDSSSSKAVISETPNNKVISP